MIDIIVDRLDVRASIPEIPDAGPTITARRADDTAEGIEIPDARSSGEADGIDEPAEGMNETDARIDIHDDGRNVIDAMTDEHDGGIDVIGALRGESAEPTDQSARGGEGPDERIDRIAYCQRGSPLPLPSTLSETRRGAAGAAPSSSSSPTRSQSLACVMRTRRIWPGCASPSDR